MFIAGNTIEVPSRTIEDGVKSELYRRQKNLREVLGRKIDWTDIPFQECVVNYLDAFQARYFPPLQTRDPINKVNTVAGLATVITDELAHVIPKGQSIYSHEEIMDLITASVQDPVAVSLQEQNCTAFPRAATLVILDQVGANT